MALSKQTKQFVFAQGIDTKTTPELMPIGKLHSAENIRFNNSGRISKKRGSTALGTTEIPVQGDNGGTLPAVRGVFSHLSGLYAIAPKPTSKFINFNLPDDIYAYSSSQDKWSYVSSCVNVAAESRALPNGSNASSTAIAGLIQDKGQCDGVYVNGYFFAAMVDTETPAAMVSQILCTDVSTNETVVYSIDSNFAQTVRVVKFGNSALVVGYSSGAGLVCRQYDTTNLTGQVSTVTLSSTMVSTKLWDCFVSPSNGALYCAYQTATGIEINRFNTIPSSGTATKANTATIAETPVNCLSIFGGESTFQRIYTAYGLAATGTRLNFRDLTLGTSSIITAAVSLPKAIAGAFATNAGGNYVLMCIEFDGASSYQNTIATNGLTASTSTSLTSTYPQYQLGLASKIYTLNGINYVVMVTTDPIERTYFLTALDQSTTGTANRWYPVAKLLFGSAGFAPRNVTGAYLPLLAAGDASNVYCVGLKFLQVTNSVSTYTLQLLKFDFSTYNPNLFQSREISGLTYLTGGFLKAFDGRKIFEAAFLHSPRQPVAGSGSVSTGSLTLLGTYQMCVVFEFYDTQGNLHQSAPSVPLSVTLTGSQNTITFSALSPCLSLHFVVAMAIYTTAANGTVFYRNQVIAGTGNGVPVSVTLTMSDATLLSQPLLYTEGNVIENQCPTACRAITLWKDRIWLLTDDGLVFSKNVTDGFVAAWNPALNMNTIINKTNPTAIAGVRDKLFAFYQDDIFYTAGDGPSDVGDGAFSPLEAATSGIGCVSSAACVETDNAAYFQSRDGWRMIDSSLNMQYIGAELQNYISENTVIYKAMFFDNLHEIRILDGARTYIYDTFEKQWSIAKAWIDYSGTMFNGIGAANKRYIRMTTAGALLYEDTSTHFDAGVFTPLLVRTGWISMDQFLGFERLYKVLILGRYYTPNTLTVKVFYDYVPQVIETFTFSSASGNFAQFTDANIYDDDNYAGNGYPFEVSLRPSQQKIQAIRFEITDAYVSGNGRAFDLIGLNLVLGVKNVDAKIRDAATAAGTGRPGFIP